MVKLTGHRQTKGATTDKPNLMSPRHISTLPAIDKAAPVANLWQYRCIAHYSASRKLQKMIGTISRKRENGYGFIRVEGDSDIFFRAHDLVDMAFDDLQEVEMVTFDVELKPLLRTTPREVVEYGEVLLPYDRQEIAASSSKRTIEVQRMLTADLIQRIKERPFELYQLKPKQFEYLIAELYVVDGYSVELMGSCNQADGGVDILVIKDCGDSHKFRTAIQCKRYSAGNRVSAAPIRALAGVLDRFHAHSGALITTSEFTGPAVKEASDYWRISLIDFQGVLEKLRRAEILIKTPPSFRRVAPLKNRILRVAVNVRRA